MKRREKKNQKKEEIDFSPDYQCSFCIPVVLEINPQWEKCSSPLHSVSLKQALLLFILLLLMIWPVAFFICCVFGLELLMSLPGRSANICTKIWATCPQRTLVDPRQHRQLVKFTSHRLCGWENSRSDCKALVSSENR